MGVREALPVWPEYLNAPPFRPPLDSSSSTVVVQQTTEPLLLLDHAGVAFLARFGAEESIIQTLLVALAVVMRHELGNRFSSGALPK